MKIAIVYYSLEGNTKFVAQSLAEKLQADIIPLKLEKALPKKGFMKFFLGGKSAVLRETPELQPYTFDASTYDLVLLGTPLWANTLAAPMRSFLSKENLSSNSVALFVCSGSGQSGKVRQEVAKLIGNEVAHTLTLKNPLVKRNMALVEEAVAWAQSLVK